MICLPWSLYSHTIFLWCGEKQTSITKYLQLIKRRSKVQEKNMSWQHALNFNQWKTLSHWEFDFVLFTNLPRIVVAHDFSPSSFKPKRSILPLMTKYVPWLANYLSHFFWTKLQENLLLEKYVKSVAAPLNKLNNYHLNINFAFELEKNNKINFLGGLIKRVNNNNLGTAV